MVVFVFQRLGQGSGATGHCVLAGYRHGEDEINGELDQGDDDQECAEGLDAATPSLNDVKRY